MPKSRQIHITGAELFAKLPDGDLPETIKVDGIEFTVDQIDAIHRTIQSHLPLTIQRMRNQRLAVTVTDTMPAGVWSIYESDGSFRLSPDPIAKSTEDKED